MITILLAFLATAWIYICLGIVALVGTYIDPILGSMVGLFLFFLTCFTFINYQTEQAP
jgi:hypothetical protein